MGSLLRAMIVAVAAASVLKSAAAAPPTVVMYETRRLDGPKIYWRASYELAAAYAARHGATQRRRARCSGAVRAHDSCCVPGIV